MNTETAKIRAWVIVGSSSAALTAATEFMNGQSLASNGSPEVNSMESGYEAKPKDCLNLFSPTKSDMVFFAVP